MTIIMKKIFFLFLFVNFFIIQITSQDLNYKMFDILSHLEENKIENQLEEIKNLIKKGANVNYINTNDYNRTPLIKAVSTGRNWECFDIVELLIKVGADVNMTDNNWGSALSHAAYWGYNKIVDILIANGADVNLKDKKGKSILEKTASHKKYAAVEKLIKSGANVTDGSLIHFVNLDNNFEKDYEMVKLYLKYGAVSKDKNNKWINILSYACSYNNFKRASLILDEAVKTSKKTIALNTAISNSGMIFKIPPVNYPKNNLLIEYNEKNLEKAKETERFIHNLIRMGANVNAVNMLKNTVLMNCIPAFSKNQYQENQINISKYLEEMEEISVGLINFLIKSGSDINYKNPIFVNTTRGGGNFYLESAILVAVTFSSPRIIILLLDNGADINYRDSNGNSLFYHALVRRGEWLKDIFIDRGIDIPKGNNYEALEAALYLDDKRKINDLIKKRLHLDNTDYLKFAIHTENTDLMNLILEKANFNRETLWMALNYTSYYGYKKSAECLLNNGIDVDYVFFNKKLYSPLLQAVRNGNIELAEMLIDNGALIDRNAPLATAVKNNDIDMAKMLLQNGADPNTFSFGLGETSYPIIEAIKQKNKTVIKLLVDYGGKLNKFIDHRKVITPLMYVAGNYEYDANLLNYLIKLGAKVNMIDGEGQTALFHTGSQYEKLKVLINAGADVNLKDKYGKSALDYAEEFEDKTIYNIMLSTKQKKSIFKNKRQYK